MVHRYNCLETSGKQRGHSFRALISNNARSSPMQAPAAISIFLAPEIKLYYNQGITCVRLVTKRRDALGGSLCSVVDRVLIRGPDGCHHLLVRSDVVSRLLVLWTRVGNREGARAKEEGGHRNREKRARARDTYTKREAEQENEWHSGARSTQTFTFLNNHTVADCCVYFPFSFQFSYTYFLPAVQLRVFFFFTTLGPVEPQV